MSDEIDTTEANLLQAMSVDDTPAPTPEYKAAAGEKLVEGAFLADTTDIIEALKTVFDPEIPINIYDLGLIYKVNQLSDGDVLIDMTLTAPTCPVAGVLPQQVADAVAAVAGVGQVEVKVVWEPAWTIDRLSEDAKEMLEMF